MWETILSGVEKVNTFLNNIVWGWPGMILLLAFMGFIMLKDIWGLF